MFRALGPIQVVVDGSEVALTPRRERTLLAMLLLQANQVVPAGELADALWGANPPRDARAQIQGCVYRLRRRLAGAGITGQVIVTGQGGYRVTIDPEHVDLLEFRRLVGAARAAGRDGRSGEAAGHYRAALALWRGPALSDIDSHAVRQASTALDEERLQVLEERIQTELAAGGGGELVGELTALVRQHPHREGLHHSLMLALHRAGRQADALAAYRHARQLMHDELGTDPGPELQRLHHAILNRDPAMDAPPPPEPAGHRTGEPPPRELPAEVAGFTGRTDALKTLDEMLAAAGDGVAAPVVISAIAGTAGVGKTALAVRWSHQVADRFPDGQLYINLRGYAAGAPMRPVEALSALLRSLGTPPEQVPTDEAQAAALYRTRLADRQVLVVLDNARSVDQVRPLLPGSPGCLVLVTSRDRLAGLVARDGARRLTLDVLTPTEARALLAHMLGPDRVEAEPEAAAELAKVCAHLPLALRIAAAHLCDRPDATIAAYVSELTASDPLTSLQADGDEESAVRTALDRSYRSLPAECQRMFRLLGLVPGPDFTPMAAAALAGSTVEDATQHLRQLASAHLIDEHTPGRYTFHDLLRHYAKQLAGKGDAHEQRIVAFQRLMVHYLLSADSANRVLFPEMHRLPLPPMEGPEPVEWFDQRESAMAWLSNERPNLVAGIMQAADHGPRPLSWLLADRLRGYFVRLRDTVDWLAVAGTALTAAEKECDLQGQAAAHLALGAVHYIACRFPDAIRHYTLALRLATQVDWAEGKAAALGNLGSTHRSLGELAEAARYVAESLQLNRRNNRVGAQALNGGNLGVIYYELGRLYEAANLLIHTLALYRRVGSIRGEATALNDLGCVYHELGRLGQAHTFASGALELYREIGDRDGEIDALVLLVEVLGEAGRLDEAMECSQTCVALTDDRPIARALSMNSLGSVRLRGGRSQDAAHHYRRALGMAREAGYRPAEAGALLGLAAALHHLGDLDPAHDTAWECLELARDAGYRVVEGRTLTCLSGILLDQRRLDKAIDNALQALDNHGETGHRLGEARTLAVLGRIADATDDTEAALRHRRAALAIFDDVGSPPPDDLRDAGGEPTTG